MTNSTNSTNLIIYDWDDTLFPTSWVNTATTININNPQTYISFFAELDETLYNLLSNSLQHATVIIVTNATLSWIANSTAVLPKTQYLINNKIKTISAREIHQDEHPMNPYKWKELTFAKIGSTKYNNIISIGDADYEYQALLNMIPKRSDKSHYKAIQLVHLPNYETVLDQVKVIRDSITNMVQHVGHLDLQFHPKQHSQPPQL